MKSGLCARLTGRYRKRLRWLKFEPGKVAQAGSSPCVTPSETASRQLPAHSRKKCQERSDGRLCGGRPFPAKRCRSPVTALSQSENKFTFLTTKVTGLYVGSSHTWLGSVGTRIGSCHPRERNVQRLRLRLRLKAFPERLKVFQPRNRGRDIRRSRNRRTQKVQFPRGWRFGSHRQWHDASHL